MIMRKTLTTALALLSLSLSLPAQAKDEFPNILFGYVATLHACAPLVKPHVIAFNLALIQGELERRYDAERVKTFMSFTKEKPPQSVILSLGLQNMDETRCYSLMDRLYFKLKYSE